MASYRREMSRERYEPMSEAQLEVAWMVVLLGGALVLMGGVALNVLIDHLAVSFALAGVPSVLMVAVLWRCCGGGTCTRPCVPARKKPGSRARLFPWGGSCTPRLSVLHTGRDTYCRQAEQSYVLWHIERDRSPAGAPRGAGGCCAGHGKSRAMGEPGFSRAVCRSPTLSVWEARECVEGDRLTARPPSRGQRCEHKPPISV